MSITFCLILFCLFFAFLAWRKSVWTIAFICASLPAYLIRFKIGFVPMTLLEAMILILFACWLIKSVISNQLSLINLKKWRWPIIAWLAVATLAIFASPDLRGAAGIWKAYFIEPILFLIVFVSIIQKKKDLRLIFYGLGISALYLSGVAIWQKITGIGYSSIEVWPDVKIIRSTGFFSQPNFLGLYLGPIIILVIGQMILSIMSLRGRNPKQSQRLLPRPPQNFCGGFLAMTANLLVANLRLFYWLLITILSVLAIIFARSEGAILAIIVGVIFLGLFYKPTRNWTLIGLFVLIILVSVITPIRAFVWQKATFQDFSGQIRLKTWKETIEMLKDRPIWGAGLRGYQAVMKPYHQPILSEKLALPLEIHPYPHNIFLACWAELGILGLLAFLWIVVKFFKMATNYKFSTNIQICSLMGAMSAIIIHGLVDTPYFKNDLSMLFWLIIGMMVVARKWRRAGVDDRGGLENH